MNRINLFRFKPTKELWVVLLTWVLVVVTFYTSFQIITTKRVAGQFITFGIVGIMVLGIFTPVVWNTLIMKRPLSSIGITKDKLTISVVLCLIFSIIQYYLTLGTIQLPDFKTLLPIVSMALAVGLYENIFYRGWIQLRMEEYFGIVPGIVLSAAIYCSYHIGYGMRSDEMLVLFIIGLVYSSIFRLTANIFILYPILTPMGALFTQLKEELIIPFEATYGFLDVIVFSIVGIVGINRVLKRQRLKTAINKSVLDVSHE